MNTVEQMTLFDFEPTLKTHEAELIEFVLLRGSGVAGGKERITEFARSHPSITVFSKFLRDEYGTGGSATSALSALGIRLEMHDGSGIRLICGDSQEIKITWLGAAKVISEMIEKGRYI